MATKKGQGTGSTHKAKRLTTRERLEKAVFGKVPASPVPTFSVDGPPIDWEAQHSARRTHLTGSNRTDVRRVWWPGAMPVPRQASAHYYRPSETLTTFYFY